jgi:hypothetical protein
LQPCQQTAHIVERSGRRRGVAPTREFTGIERLYRFIRSVGGDHAHRQFRTRVPGYGDDDEAVDSRGQHRTTVVVDVVAK